MKQLKKTVVLAVLAVMMAMLASVSVKAGQQQLNTTEAIVWGKGYDFQFVDDENDGVYVYTMNLQKSGKVTFTINAEIPEYTLGATYIGVYNPSDGSEVWCTAMEPGIHTNAHSACFLAGTYDVKIYNSRTDKGKGSMVASFVASGETVNENNMNKNNQLGTATPYTVGTKVKAQFACNDNCDIYKMELKRAGYLTVRFANDISSMSMSLICPDENVKHEEYAIPLGASSYKYFVPKGTYYFTFTKDEYEGTYTFSTELSGITVTKVKSAKNLKGKKAKITWVKKNDVDGYQVQVARDTKFKKGKKTKTITKNTTKSYTFTKLKKKKTYYARVRTYKLVEGQKIYSDWSAPKKFKVKK